MDQLLCKHAADQGLCFHYTDYFLNQKFQASRHLLWLYSQVVSDPVENLKNMFSHDAGHLSVSCGCITVEELCLSSFRVIKHVVLVSENLGI